MTLIQIPDDLAAALQAKAAEQGLTLETWLKNLAGIEEQRNRKSRYTLVELIAQCDLTEGVEASTEPISAESR